MQPANGVSHSGTGFTGFSDELPTIIQARRIGLFRADSGFCNATIIKRLEQENLSSIMATRMSSPLVSRNFEHTEWFPVEDGYWAGSFLYQADGWSKPRKIVVVRKDTKTHPNTGGKLLFPDIEEFEQYKHAALATNPKFSGVMAWQWYSRRADCENRIRELKYDYGIVGFCMDDFYATEAAFRWTMVAHYLMSLFRVPALSMNHKPVLTTMRFQCIAIGFYFSKSGRKTTLVLSASEKRRGFMKEFCQKS